MRIDRQTVERKIAHTWPDHVDDIMALLDRIGVHGASASELVRVQLAVLKLCEGEREEIGELVEMASRDYRDALAYAEYPEQMTNGPVSPVGLSDGEANSNRARIARDREQYLAWLSKDGV